MSNVLMKCNLSDDECQRIFMEFDGYLSNEEEESLSQKFTQYLFYDSWGRKNYRDCICTGCGIFDQYKNENEGFFKHSHGDVTRCPNCGEEVQLYSLGRMKTGAGLKEWQRAAFIRKASDGGILLVGGYATKEYSPHDLRPMITWYEKSRTYLAPGKRGQWRRELHNYWNMFYCGSESAWQRSASVAEPFNPAMMQHDGSYWLFGLDKLADSDFKYCQIEDWWREITGDWLCEERYEVRQVYKYLARYTEFPQMEMAVKLGLHRAVEELVMDGRQNANVLNWKTKTVQDFLRMNKQDAKAFLAAGGDIAQLIHCKTSMKSGAIKSVQEYLQLIRQLGTMDALTRTTNCANLAGVDIKKAVSYVRKQAVENGTTGQIHAVGSAIMLWNDYLTAAKHLELDLSNETVAMPKDLQERHDAVTQMILLQADAEERKKYKSRYKQLRDKYEFRLGDLCIVVPKDSQQIVAEGKTLDHCVGGYAPRHMKGVVDILFLRHVRRPERSFLTIEMVPWKTGSGKPVLRQIHGYKNERYKNPVDPKIKYAWFIDTWMEWLKSGSKRDKNGQPVMPAGKEKTA